MYFDIQRIGRTHALTRKGPELQKLHVNRVFCLLCALPLCFTYLFGLFVVKTCESII